MNRESSNKIKKNKVLNVDNVMVEILLKATGRRNINDPKYVRRLQQSLLLSNRTREET